MGRFLTVVPVEEAVRAGVGADVPLLMGATAHEFTEMGEEFSVHLQWWPGYDEAQVVEE